MKKWLARTVLACVVIGGVALASVMVARWLNPEPAYQGRTLTQWLSQLRDRDPSARMEAMTAVRAIGADAVPRLTNELAQAPSGFNRLARATSEYVPDRLKRVLRRIYNPSAEVVRKHMALQAIGLLGTNGSAAVPAVSQVLRGPDVGLTSAAAAALYNLGTNSLPALIPALDDGDFDVRAHACYALRQLRTNAAPAVPRLARIVAEERGPIVDAALVTLSAIGEPAVPALTNLLSDVDPPVRRGAALALGEIGFEARPAVPALIAAATDSVENVRAAAIQALGRIDWVGREAGAAVLPAVDDPAAKVREAAAKALLYRVGLVRLNLNKVCELLEDESSEVRAAAARAIGQLGEHGTNAVPFLQALLTDTNEAVRLNATKALETIAESTAIGAQRIGGKIEAAGKRRFEERSF